MTCNPNWPEIKENLRPGQTASDRPDIVARVFMQKLKAINKDLDEGLLGIQAARVHVVEYQKRGLPHAHILLISRPKDKPVSAEDVDRLVSAELPDKEKYPELYETVISSMMHGPCGLQNPHCPCMKNGRCSKKFPKPLSQETTMVADKYPTYRRRRRPDGILNHKGNVWDSATINQWMPYNAFLPQKYNCHINVEVCATSKAIKYIYKYVYKGSDMTTITIDGEEIEANESRQYLLERYISPIEACNRLFMHPTQGSTHSVVNLPIHLEDMNMVAYRSLATTAQLHDLIYRGSCSMLTEFFSLCSRDLEGTADLLYKDVPTNYRCENRRWKLYKKYVASLGRIVHVTPQDPDQFYLRLLLCYRRSPKSFEGLRRVGATTYSTFRDAAFALGYLEDDQEWLHCLTEAAAEKMPYQLRQLFGIILVYPGADGDNLPDKYFVERAILTPTNASVRWINDIVAERLTGDTKEYISVESLEGVAGPNMFQQEFLNPLNFSGIPPRKIVLKVGTPIIMIRILNIDAGLCNSIRLRVVSPRERSIEATARRDLPRARICLFPGSSSTQKMMRGINRFLPLEEDDHKEFPFKMKRK